MQAEAPDQVSPYAPPQAEVHDFSEPMSEFFVVSPRKFIVLYFFTFGYYQFYWFYMQWARFRRWHNEPLWPVARALFAIFFIHRLNDEVDGSLRKSGAAYRWFPGSLATGYIVCVIGRGVFSVLANENVGFPWINLIALGLLVAMAFCLLPTQRAANAACGDRSGEGNARLTFANYVWLILGGLMWALFLAGMVLLLVSPSIDITLPRR